MYVRLPDPYGTDQIARFDKAFIQCLQEGLYPGPKYIGIKMYGQMRRSITGVLVERRREMMCMFGVSFQKSTFVTARGRVPRPGNIPRDHWDSYDAANFELD